MRRLVLLLLAATLWSSSHAQVVTRLIVFGDSYSDIGRGYLDGNGPTAVAYLAQRLGSPMVPSNAKDLSGRSLNFAVSGAQTGEGKGFEIGGFLLGYGMRNQVEEFSAMVKSGRVSFDPATTLFFIAGGLNDSRRTTDDTISNLTAEIAVLYSLGARRFEVAILPESIPGFHNVAVRLNPSLAMIQQMMKPKLPMAQIRSSQWGAYFDEVMAHPSKYGIVNTTDRCAGREIRHEDTKPCAKPETYFYYHEEHPSTATQKAVGDMLYDELKRYGGVAAR
ncbi:Phospholipase/lecithinase/hemolysin [Bryocella elongata]|uniref:Phospholipase/lecithinase/hemolysin n=1 Tax=Bryocella elongata TaxID=863522 RepID=A0A1H5U2N5_9BACT|nr:SGNH/GDSL hydrolase family protein [Bryocella elongata]SEF68678.1 Phospholipase/lecithinase/hemolysin [Bryocella elongata]